MLHLTKNSIYNKLGMMSSKRSVTCHLDPDEFQFFFGTNLMIEYQQFQEVYFDMHIMMVMFVLCVCFYLGRCNVSHPFDDGLYFTTSFCCTVTSFFLYHIFLLRYVVKYFGAAENSRLYRALDYLVHPREGQGNIFNDITAIVGVVGVGFGLFARVFKGQCEQNVSIWEAQRCNPAANSFSLPQDHVIFLLILPLHCQSVINGMTFRATIICWLITVISIIISIIHVGGAYDIWIVHLSLFILGIAYKNEKLARLTFAHNKKISLAEEEKMKYIVLQQQTERQLLLVKNRHELEILSIKAEEECRLMVKEKKQMVALIGNVAHDLKTPLQSFLMDLESLKADPGLKRHLDTVPDDHDGPRHILQSLESTCCFMSMAINRSIDFAKASKSIALVPLMESFNLPEAAFLAINVIRHLKSSLKIITNPFPSTMCLDIITDKQWFTENILCLLSNAVKYSNGGIVTLTVTHLTSPTTTLEDEEYRESCQNGENIENLQNSEKTQSDENLRHSQMRQKTQPMGVMVDTRDGIASQNGEIRQNRQNSMCKSVTGYRREHGNYRRPSYHANDDSDNNSTEDNSENNSCRGTSERKSERNSERNSFNSDKDCDRNEQDSNDSDTTPLLDPHNPPPSPAYPSPSHSIRKAPLPPSIVSHTPPEHVLPPPFRVPNLSHSSNPSQSSHSSHPSHSSRLSHHPHIDSINHIDNINNHTNCGHNDGHNTDSDRLTDGHDDTSCTSRATISNCTSVDNPADNSNETLEIRNEVQNENRENRENRDNRENRNENRDNLGKTSENRGNCKGNGKDLPPSTSTIMISIEDAGIGISEEAREELFQPFKQVQRLAGGTGLGLYSLSNRIRALNGTRGVRSRGDGKQGSVFWFAIPYRPDPDFLGDHTEDKEDGRNVVEPQSYCSSRGSASSSQNCTDGNNTPESFRVKTMRFLIIDDSSSILKVLGRALTNKKYEVETADNGSTGLNRLIEGYATKDFDVVLMDLQMPVMDGIEAVRRYREYEAEQMTLQAKSDSLHAIEKMNQNSDKTDKLENSEQFHRSNSSNGMLPDPSITPNSLNTSLSHSKSSSCSNLPMTSSEHTSEHSLKKNYSSPTLTLSEHSSEHSSRGVTSSEQSSILPMTSSEQANLPSILSPLTSTPHTLHTLHTPNTPNTPHTRRTSHTPHTPHAPHTPKKLFIIGMSANSDEDTKQCALNAGMSTFLSKPFTLAELLPLVDHLRVMA